MSSEDGLPFPSAENPALLSEEESDGPDLKTKGDEDDAKIEGAEEEDEVDEPKVKAAEPLAPHLTGSEGRAAPVVALAPSLSPLPLADFGWPNPAKLPGGLGIEGGGTLALDVALFFSTSLVALPLSPPTFSSNFFFSVNRRLLYISRRLPMSTNGSLSMAFLTVESRERLRPRICER